MSPCVTECPSHARTYIVGVLARPEKAGASGCNDGDGSTGSECSALNGMRIERRCLVKHKHSSPLSSPNRLYVVVIYPPRLIMLVRYNRVVVNSV
jgi:hypothetical protein